MNFWVEVLEVVVIPIVAIALLLGGFLWLPTLRQRKKTASDLKRTSTKEQQSSTSTSLK